MLETSLENLWKIFGTCPGIYPQNVQQMYRKRLENMLGKCSESVGKMYIKCLDTFEENYNIEICKRQVIEKHLLKLTYLPWRAKDVEWILKVYK